MSVRPSVGLSVGMLVGPMVTLLLFGLLNATYGRVPCLVIRTPGERKQRVSYIRGEKKEIQLHPGRENRFSYIRGKKKEI